MKNKLIHFIIINLILFLNTTFALDSKNANLYEELKTFTDVITIVQRDYVNNVDEKKLISGAIEGMLTTLDPHSSYLDPDFYNDLQVQTKGEFGGLGIEITIKEGLLSVVTPMEGSPAEKAGVKAGDKIIKIDGSFTNDYSLVDAVKRLRGKINTQVVISVQREGLSSLIDIPIVREVINVKSIKSRYLGDGFGYVRISQFMETTTKDLKQALSAIKKESTLSALKGLILDLRNNPGGLLNQAISVSDLFLKDGVVVYTEGRVKDQKQKFYAKDNGDEPTYPIVVLVNGGSASASEIVSGAFKDHGRALIVGTQTFGKGSVQTITPLENGGAVTLTTALYYTKSGNSIQAKGVTPDIEVEYIPYKQDNIQDKNLSKGIKIREKDLPRAIKNPGSDDESNPMKKLNKIPSSKIEAERIDPETVDLKEWLKKDNQFNRALDLLKSFKVFQVKNLVG